MYVFRRKFAFERYKKKILRQSQEQKQKKKHEHTYMYNTLHEGYCPFTDISLPPTQCISDPLLLFGSCTQLVNPIYPKKNFSQYMTHDNTILTKRTLQAHTMEKNIILLLLCSWLLLPSPPVVLLSVHSHVLWQSLYKLNQK